MGCTTSKTKRTSSSDTAPSRGPPPQKVYVRGTGELPCDGTYRRIWPNPKCKNKKIPRLLVVYTNKRGYTLTNARINDNSPKLHTRMWCIGRGQYPQKPWKGIFVATHKRYYRFDRNEESESIRPPKQGWTTTEAAYDSRSYPLVAFDRRGDREIRHRSFRISHGLEDPPIAPSMKSFPPERLQSIREEAEGGVGLDYNYSSEEEDIEINHEFSKGDKSQFETSRDFAELGKDVTNKSGNNQEESQEIIGQFESYRSSVQKIQQNEKKETDEEIGFKSRTPSNEYEPIITSANTIFTKKHDERVEFSQRQNLMFELEQAKWKEREISSTSFDDQRIKNIYAKNIYGASSTSVTSNNTTKIPSENLKMNHLRLQKALNKQKLSRKERLEYNIDGVAQPPKSPQRRSTGIPLPPDNTANEDVLNKQKREMSKQGKRKHDSDQQENEPPNLQAKKVQIEKLDIQSRSEQLFNAEKEAEQTLKMLVDNERANSHHRLKIAREKKIAVMKARQRAIEMNEMNTKKSELLQQKKHALLGLKSVNAFIDVNSRVEEVLQNERNVEQVMRVKMLNEKSTSHKRLMAKRDRMAAKRKQRNSREHKENAHKVV